MKYLVIFDSPQTKGYDAFFWGEAAKLGLHRADCDTLNLVEVMPEKVGKPPKAADVRANAANFYAQLAEKSGRVIVPLGPDASRAVLGLKMGIETLRGYVFTKDDLGMVTLKHKEKQGVYKSGEKKGQPKIVTVSESNVPALPEDTIYVIPTYSLGYIIAKRKKQFFAFAQDLRRAKKACDGTLALDDSVFDVCRAFKIKPIIGWEPVNGRFAFDIETAQIGPDTYSREPRSYAGFSISDGVVTMCLDWNDETREYIKPYLASPNYVKYAHNTMFDVPRLRDAGAPVAPPIVDTMIQAQLLQPDLLKRLETQASVYLNLKQWKKESEADPYFYSAKDSFVTILLADELEKRLANVGMSALSERICSALPVLLAMNEEGIRVDVPRAQAWAEKLKLELTALEEKWILLTVPHNVSPRSVPALHKYLYGTLGMVPQKNKEDGSTVDGEALFNLKMLYPAHAELISTLSSYRGLKKQYGTYAKTLAGLFTKGTDRVFPEYLPGGSEGETFGAKGGASTGRLGVRNPNIQNQTPEARRMYVPDNEGQVFLEFDYSQAELRIIAALSHDENLQRALSEDIHQRTADRLGISRALAKNVLYASSYLGGPKTIQSMMKKKGTLVDIPTIKAAQALIKAEYPRMAAWQQATVAQGQSQGYLINPFGRVRFFYDKSKDGPEMADYLPQSSIADITWKVMEDADRIARRAGGRLVTQVHDSFLILVDTSIAKYTVKHFKEILEQPFHEVAKDFYIPVEVKLGLPGASWGELEKETVSV
jgi:DNA polymerase I-like protein with 3'-5' exonuclease and polymerase domains